MIYTEVTEDIPGSWGGVLGERKLSHVRLGYENTQVCPADGKGLVVRSACRATVGGKSVTEDEAEWNSGGSGAG